MGISIVFDFELGTAMERPALPLSRDDLVSMFYAFVSGVNEVFVLCFCEFWLLS